MSDGTPDSLSDRAESCPVPAGRYDHVVLGHGSGGRLGDELLRSIFLPAFGLSERALEDQASLPLEAPAGTRLALTTDSFVVKPLVFPGGDIGKLAICGTINDLAVGGAIPKWIAASFILEEGLSLETLRAIVDSMARTAAAEHVEIVTGDTKVVERGNGDGVFITTTGAGLTPAGRALSVGNARPGDHVLVSGPIADHGIAILTRREGLTLETEIESDCQSLRGLCGAMLEGCPRIRWMRDATRGGVSSVLHELARASRVGVRLDEASIPIRETTRGVCELLGLDPLYVANEGTLVVVAPADASDALLDAMRAHPAGRGAARIGIISEERAGTVTMRSVIGGERIVSMLSGEQLPRIC